MTDVAGHAGIILQNVILRVEHVPCDEWQDVDVTAVGDESTRLVILRGDSASGKTTTAVALRHVLGPKVALLHQDYFRREILTNVDRRERAVDASDLLVSGARAALDLGYDVILDGIFSLRDYSRPFEDLCGDHRGQTRVYQFDVGLEETLRRHAQRPLSDVVSPDKLREWYSGWQPLPWCEEIRVGGEVAVDDLVSLIMQDLARASDG